MSRTSKAKSTKRTSRKLNAPHASDQVQTTCNGYPGFSFRFLTTNNRYNLKSLNCDDLRFFFARLQELSGETWVTLFARQKKTSGLEFLLTSQLDFEIPKGLTASLGLEKTGVWRLDKVMVFRFAHQKGRILGMKPHDSDVYYILGIDTHFQAYDHG